jgi:hypothetical protein
LSLRPTAWQDALTRLRRTDFAVIKRAFPGYLYPDLLHAIEVSVEALDETDRERYLDLAKISALETSAFTMSGFYNIKNQDRPSRFEILT